MIKVFISLKIISNRIKKYYYLSPLILFSFYSNATHKPEIGLGATNNVDYSDSNKQSDTYLWLKHSSFIDIDTNSLIFWFSYKDFSKSSPNDVLNWKTIFSLTNENDSSSESEINLSIGGQNYPRTSPKTTDESYNNTHLSISWLRSFSTQKVESIYFEPGYQFTQYSDTNNRKDHRLSITGGADITISLKSILSPFSELGFVISNDSIYTKNYFDLGFDFTHKLTENMKILTSIFNRTSWFPNRTLTTTRTVNAKRGNRNSSLSQNEIETLNIFHFDISLINEFKSFSTKATLSKVSQTSKSHLENFDEMGLRLTLMKSF